MPWIERDKDGKIVGLFACEQFKGQEFLAEDGPELETFREERKTKANIENKILARANSNARNQAISQLVAEGEIPPDAVKEV